jgi:hypothetical protein
MAQLKPCQEEIGKGTASAVPQKGELRAASAAEGRSSCCAMELAELNARTEETRSSI